MLGLKFPCGPQLEQLALNNTENSKFVLLSRAPIAV